MIDELRERVARAIEAADLAHPHAPFNYLAFADAAIALIWNEAMEEAATVAEMPCHVQPHPRECEHCANSKREYNSTFEVAAAIRARKQP